MGVKNKGFDAPWKEWADEYGKNARATSRDQIQFDLEANAILSLIRKEGERVFDVGCGNGATLAKLMDLGLKPSALGGCDELADFVGMAHKELKMADVFQMDISSDETQLWGRIKNFAPTTVIIKRVLCNLSGRKQQRTTLNRVCGCLPRGARIIVIEPMLEGFIKLNHLRIVMGLDTITEPPFNEYLRWTDIRVVLEKSGISDISYKDYLGTYFLGSRILQPYLWPGEEPKYDHFINKFFSELPVIEGFGLHWLTTGVKL